jgi:hypothetical protein
MSQKLPAAVSPLGVLGGRATREHRIPSAKPTIRTIAVFSIESPQIRELEVTFKSHQTYMNPTDVFFKQTFVVDL